MYDSPPKVLILGHSFVRRLKVDLNTKFEKRASLDFGLCGSANVHMHGVGGRTVSKLRRHDLGVVSHISPHIVILEIGTNDLSHANPEVVGSEIEELVKLLSTEFSVKVVGVCHVTPRDNLHGMYESLNKKALVLNQYVRVVLEHIEPVFCWTHQGFLNPSVSPFLPDGVHFNHIGQYNLYRSYRGAILAALRAL